MQRDIFQFTGPVCRWVYVNLLIFVLMGCGGGGGGGNATGGNGNPGNGNNNNPVNVQPIDPATLNFEVFFLPSEFVRLEYPTNWFLTRNGSEPEVLINFIESELPTESTAGSILLIKVDVAGLEDDEDVEIISERTITIDGIEGLEEIGDTQIDGFDVRIISTAIEFGGLVYSLAYVNFVDYFNKNIEIYRHMVSTLKVGQNLMENFDTGSSFYNPGKAALASDGNGFIYVSCERQGVGIVDYDLIGRIISNDRIASTPFVIDTDVGGDAVDCRNVNANIIFDGINYLVVYVAERAADSLLAVFGKRIATDGTVLDPVSIDISQQIVGDVYRPEIAFDGARALVVWQEETQDGVTETINGAFVEPDGDVTAPIVISNNLDDDYPTHTSIIVPEVAYTDNRYLISWAPEYFVSPAVTLDRTIYAQIVDLTGVSLLGPRIPIRSDTGTTPRYQQASADGDEFLVAWIEGGLTDGTGSSGSFSIRARRISVAGALLNGDENTTGTLIAGPLTNTGSAPATESPKDFLALEYLDGEYVFLWSVLEHAPRGVYGATATGLLGEITGPQALVGTLADVDPGLDNLEILVEPAITRSSGLSMIAWPSRAGWVEGWFFEDAIISE